MVVIDALDVAAYTIPTDAPESDGTFAWHSTTIVVVQPRAGDVTGLGYSYADERAAHLVAEVLAPLAVGRDALAVPAI